MGGLPHNRENAFFCDFPGYLGEMFTAFFLFRCLQKVSELFYLEKNPPVSSGIEAPKTGVIQSLMDYNGRVPMFKMCPAILCLASLTGALCIAILVIPGLIFISPSLHQMKVPNLLRDKNQNHILSSFSLQSPVYPTVRPNWQGL